MRGDVRLEHVQGVLEPRSGLAGGEGTELELAGNEGRGGLSGTYGGTGVVGDGGTEGLEGAAEEDAGAIGATIQGEGLISLIAGN
jgi:hypothetical protein